MPAKTGLTGKGKGNYSTYRSPQRLLTNTQERSTKPAATGCYSPSACGNINGTADLLSRPTTSKEVKPKPDGGEAARQQPKATEAKTKRGHEHT